MRSSRRRASPDVDLTPLVDILFSFILFFVLTTSFTQRHVPVDLPSGRGEAGASQGIVITVDRNGTIFVDGVPVTAQALADSSDLAHPPRQAVFVKGDANVPYGTVAGVLDLLRQRGISSAGLVLAPGGSPGRNAP